MGERMSGRKECGEVAVNGTRVGIRRTFDGAQVIPGGAKCRRFCPETMESKFAPGLFDVAGPCGGVAVNEARGWVPEGFSEECGRKLGQSGFRGEIAGACGSIEARKGFRRRAANFRWFRLQRGIAGNGKEG